MKAQNIATANPAFRNCGVATRARLLRYFIRVTVTRNYKRDVKEQDFVVQIVQPPPTSLTAIKMEVGIEECLHIEFEYDKQK